MAGSRFYGFINILKLATYLVLSTSNPSTTDFLDGTFIRDLMSISGRFSIWQSQNGLVNTNQQEGFHALNRSKISFDYIFN
jgi:hypothetical protein